MFRQASKKETSKHHDRSLDDFVKHLKRYNLKSERYDRMMSPDPLAPYRNNTAQTLERSRTLSGKHSRKTNKTTRQKVERMLGGSLSKEKHRNSGSKIPKTNSSNMLANPADLISLFSKRIRETQRFLQGKSKMGLLLCRKFLEMLNEIVENMVLNLQQNLQQLERSISERVEKEIGERAEKRVAILQKKLSKMERQTTKLLEKQNYNSNLIYHLRLNNLDVDRQFGKCIFKSDDFGGPGYGARSSEKSELGGHIDYMSSSQLYEIKRIQQQQSGNKPEQGESGEWQWSPGKRRRQT